MDSKKINNISDVAKKAGVSIATVSRALNNGSIKSTTKKKVLDAIKELNYKPQTAGAIRYYGNNNYKKKVHIVSPVSKSPYYNDMLYGIIYTLRIYNFTDLIDIYDGENSYDDIVEGSRFFGDIKGLIHIGDIKEVDDKFSVSILEDFTKFIVDEKYHNEKFGFFASEDLLLEKILKKHIITNENNSTLINVNEKNDDSINKYIVPNVNDAFALMNKYGISKDIYVVDNVEEVKKNISNIKQMDIPFYTIGAVLAGVMMRRLDKLKPVQYVPKFKKVVKVEREVDIIIR